MAADFAANLRAYLRNRTLASGVLLAGPVDGPAHARRFHAELRELRAQHLIRWLRGEAYECARTGDEKVGIRQRLAGRVALERSGVGQRTRPFTPDKRIVDGQPPVSEMVVARAASRDRR